MKNIYLRKLLKSKDKDNDEVWSSIITNGGSVQHLDFLSDQEKAVFKTAIELNQDWLIRLAGERQEYICQGQSLNIFFPAGASKRYLHQVHFNAWKYGCKGLYYLRTETSNRAENVAQKIERDKLQGMKSNDSQEECTACQG